MKEPPPRPWTSGVHEGYRCSHLLVKIVEDSLGWVFSEHGFASSEDEATAAGMRGHGLHQVAHVLLTEALRREVYMCLLAEMSKHPDMLQWYAQGEESYQKQFRERLVGAALAGLMGTAQKMLPDIAREVVNMGISQLGGMKEGSSE